MISFPQLVTELLKRRRTGDRYVRARDGDRGMKATRLTIVFVRHRRNWGLLMRFSMVGGTGVFVNLLVFALLLRTVSHPHGVVLPIIGTDFNVRWYHGFSTVAFCGGERLELPAQPQLDVSECRSRAVAARVRPILRRRTRSASARPARADDAAAPTLAGLTPGRTARRLLGRAR